MRAQLLTKGVENVDKNNEMLESFQKDQKERRVLRTPLSRLGRVSQVFASEGPFGQHPTFNADL